MTLSSLCRSSASASELSPDLSVFITTCLLLLPSPPPNSP